MSFFNSFLFNWYRDYLSTSLEFYRKQILFAIAVFILGIVSGYYDLLGMNGTITETINKLAAKFGEHQGITLFVNIFFQNAKATAIIIFSGIFFAIFPVLATLFNGMIIGYLVSNIDRFSQFSRLEGILYTIPHGLFEIPAIILAIALGIKLGLWPFSDHILQYLKKSLMRSLQGYLLLIVPLLFIAGIIETSTIEILRK